MKRTILALFFFLGMGFQTLVASGDGTTVISGEVDDVVTDKDWSQIVSNTVDKSKTKEKEKAKNTEGKEAVKQEKTSDVVDKETLDKQVAAMVDKSKRQAEVLSEREKGDKADAKPSNDTIYVMPELRKILDLSRIDINRFHCERGDLSGAIFSEDKGITVTRTGKDAFLRIVPETYAFDIPFELFLICSEGNDSSVYRIIGNPVEEMSKNVILKDDSAKVTDSINFFKGKDRDQVLVEMIEKSWSEEWEPYWKIIPRYQRVANEADYRITWYRTIETNSEWVIEQYIIESLKDDLPIPETAFVNRNTAAVSVFDPTLKNGQLGQVVVVREIVDSI